MKLDKFNIEFEPFELSEITSTTTEYGTSEEDARNQFEKRHPGVRVKSVTPA
jgi:hypothetical protein